MSSIPILVLVAYYVTLGVLAVYGFHRHALVWLYVRHRRRRPGPVPAVGPAPLVTVQLPVFNELYVVERLIDAAAALRHPRLEIQVLDDSDDETVERVRSCVAKHRARGVDIHHVRRAGREGYKAGALEEGMRRARGEFLLLLDADFVPRPDLLERTLGHFADPGVGMVQVRWGHLNRDDSLLTRIQAILLDGHFVIEHGARSRSGRLFNFNGTAGVWRRTAIVSAGGWQHDTLTEDLDLSYRAQLAGWRFVFLPDVVCPAELPVEMNAFRAQQRRWAKGSMETCRKLLLPVLRSDLSPWVKLEAAFHLTANLAYPLVVLLSLLMFPALAVRHTLGLDTWLLVDVPLLCGATLSVASFYAVAVREAEPADWRRRLRYLPAVLAMGVGLSLNNARAVVEGVWGRRSGFERTPKLALAPGEEWSRRRYRGPRSLLPLLELGLAGYLGVLAAWAVAHGLYAALPFVLLFLGGFGYSGALSLVQSRRAVPAA